MKNVQNCKFAGALTQTPLTPDSTPSDPLAGGEGELSPPQQPFPLSALWALLLGPVGLTVLVGPSGLAFAHFSNPSAATAILTGNTFA